MTNVSNFRNSIFLRSFTRLTVDSVMSGPKPKNEWMVWPWTFSAATPVGATTAIFFLVAFLKNACKQGRFARKAKPVR